MHVANSVHAPDALRAAAMIRARDLAKLSGTGYAITKRLVRSPGAELARSKIPAELSELAAMLG